METTIMCTQNCRLLDLIENGCSEQVMRFLFRKHPVSQEELNKSLILACRHGYKPVVQTLVQRGANVNYKDLNGNTPLMIAVENSFIDIAKFLLSCKADINAINNEGNSALILSLSSSASKEMAKHLLKQAEVKINHQNNDGYSAIMVAAEASDIEMINLLLDAYFNLDVRNISGDEENGNSEIAEEYALNWKTLDETVNYKGETAHEIAEKCGIGNVFRLLKRSKLTELPPLELAMEEKDIKSFVFLLHCEFLYTTDMKKCIDNVFTAIFKSYYLKGTKQFKEIDASMIQALLKCGADVNCSWYDDKFLYKRFPTRSQRCYGRLTDPLVTASKLGFYNIVELLLTYKADTNRYEFPNSALNFALCYGHIDCAKLLIQHGATLDFQQALEIAVDQQEPKYFNFLFDNYHREIMKYFMDNPRIQNELLISAVKGGNVEIIGQILDTGVDINDTIFPGVTPLAESKNGEVAQFLIDRGVDVNHVTSVSCKSQTPLITVLIERYRYDCCAEKVIQVLLENGAHANVVSWDGETPLIVAALKEGSRSVLQLLLDHGAELCDTDEEGNTALMHAALGGCSQNVSFLLQCTKGKKELLNLQNRTGLTALMCAVSCRNFTIIKELIAHGADVNIRDANGNTALIHSLNQFPVPEDEIAAFLIESGCEVNCQNNDGLSPLMLAAKNCLKETISTLLDSGAEINAVSEKDRSKTALTLLPSITDLGCDLTNDYFSCMDYLLDRGANPAYISPVAFHKIIHSGRIRIIPKLISCGLPPVDITSHEMHLISNELNNITSLSPISSALMAGKCSLAHYFMDNLYLTSSDIPSLSDRNAMRLHLEKQQFVECLNFMNDFSTQAVTLFNLSFVAISTAVGSSHSREDRVNKLPLPQIIKDKLLFKSQVLELITPATTNQAVLH
ncbi:hypothetical protein BsWGS_23732 [Bradybaena similaris]